MTATVPTPRTAPRRAAHPARRPRGGVLVRLLLAVALVAVTWTWWAGTSSSLGRAPGTALTAAGQLTGMLAGLLVCVQVLLVARTPWLEAAVGLDRLVAWHRTVGTAVLLLVVSHVILAVLGGERVGRLTFLSELRGRVLDQPEVLHAVIGTAVLLAAGLTSARALRRRLSYETWYWLHALSYVGIYLAFGHQIHGSAHFAGGSTNRLAWVALYVATAAVVLVWRVVLPGISVLRHRVRVAEVVGESAGVTSVWLEGPHLDEVEVRGGQFFLFRFLVRGHRASAHPYSVSSLPSRGRMRITVGALGDHSSAVSELVPGTWVLMHGPYGRFTAESVESSEVLLIAGGVGIGPITTLAHDLVEQRRDVVVLHRGSTVHLPLAHELAGDPRLHYLPVVGRRADLGHDPLSARDLTRLVPDLRHREVFVCASPGLSRSVTSTLRSLGVAQRKIHVEQLSLL